MNNFIPEIWSGKTIEYFYNKFGEYAKKNRLSINIDYEGHINQQGAEIQFADKKRLVVGEMIKDTLTFTDEGYRSLPEMQSNYDFMTSECSDIAERLLNQFLKKDDLHGIDYFACMGSSQLEGKVLITQLWYGMA